MRHTLAEAPADQRRKPSGPQSAVSAMHTPPSVSVVIATYNRAGYLPECLDSLLAQTQAAREIVLVDDGSEAEKLSLPSRA